MNADRHVPHCDPFSGRERLVVLAPHPDDESLACGALLARAFAAAGAHVICMTDGSASHPASEQWSPQRLAAHRKGELEKALRRLGGTARDLTWMGLPDSRLHLFDPAEVARKIAHYLANLSTRHVFAPAIEDHHSDHKVTARIAAELRALRPDLTFHSYPVWSRWDEPDFLCSIRPKKPIFMAPKEMLSRKRVAVQAHESQLGRVVCDDPDGFVLPPAMIEKFVGEAEIFWEMP